MHNAFTCFLCAVKFHFLKTVWSLIAGVHLFLLKDFSLKRSMLGLFKSKMSLWKRSEVSLNLTIEIVFGLINIFWTGRSYVSRFCSLLGQKLFWKRSKVVLFFKKSVKGLSKNIRSFMINFPVSSDERLVFNSLNFQCTVIASCQKKWLALKMVVFLFTKTSLKSGWCFCGSFSALAAQTYLSENGLKLLSSCCSKMSLWKRSAGLLLNCGLLWLKVLFIKVWSFIAKLFFLIKE